MSEVDQIQKFEKHIEKLQEAVEFNQVVDRLYANPDFKKVILDQFMVQEAARYAQLSGDPALNADQRADALAIAQSAGHLKRWLDVVEKMALKAAEDIPQCYAQIEELRAGINAPEHYED